MGDIVTYICNDCGFRRSGCHEGVGKHTYDYDTDFFMIPDDDFFQESNKRMYNRPIILELDTVEYREIIEQARYESEMELWHKNECPCCHGHNILQWMTGKWD